MKKYFIDNTHVMTDYMGGWDDQWREIGWYDNNSKMYFNPDEVKEIFDNGEAENVGIREDGSLYMKTCWLDARTAFSIICGIPFNVSEKNENLLSYAKKVGWITESPIPIKMYSGTKELIVNEDGTFAIKYTLDKGKYKSPNTEFLKKICVGGIKRLKNKTYTSYHDDIKEKKYYFSCGEVDFDEDSLTLIINNIPYSEVYKRDLIDAIRNLDLELLMSNYNIVNFSNVLSACHDWCRDYGQFHWIGEDRTEESEKHSNVYWYDK